MLASKSPRRSQILQQIGLKFETYDPRFEEDLDKSKMTVVTPFLELLSKRRSTWWELPKERQIKRFIP